MSDKITASKRNKPRFYRTAWTKMHKLGKKVKSKRKWRNAYGRDNKRRLKERGYARTPNKGWGADAAIKNQVNGLQAFRVETMGDFDNFPKGYGVIIGSVGKKKKMELTAKANELNLTILNKYKPEAKK